MGSGCCMLFFGVHRDFPWSKSGGSDSTPNSTFCMFHLYDIIEQAKHICGERKCRTVVSGVAGYRITWRGAWRTFWGDTFYILIGSEDALICATVKTRDTLKMGAFRHI